VAFDNRLPNVVAFGDSNEYVFGPALKRWLVAAGHYPADQIVVKYRISSRPRNWLAPGDRLHAGDFGNLWGTRGQFPDGPPISEALSPTTALVEIGLGGNLGLSDPEARSVVALVEQVKRLAPYARILWRGLPPATASRGGQAATRATKLGRYKRNAALKRALAPAGFAIFGAQLTTGHDSATFRRGYLDLIAMHAGGPAPGDTTHVGTDAALAYERSVLASATSADAVAGEQVICGPWTQYVRSRDEMEVHVPPAAADALVSGQLGPCGVYGHAAPPRPAGGYAADVVVHDAWIRGGPPDFRWQRPGVIPIGTPLLVQDWQGEYALVRGFDGRDWGWTARSNLRFR
jgi:hypothetical protein